MKNKIYKNTTESLAEFLVDLRNDFKVSMSEGYILTRTNGRHNYCHILTRMVSSNIKSNLSVYYDSENEPFVRVVIDHFQLSVRLSE
jgi:hypothetical protein